MACRGLPRPSRCTSSLHVHTRVTTQSHPIKVQKWCPSESMAGCGAEKESRRKLHKEAPTGTEVGYQAHDGPAGAISAAYPAQGGSLIAAGGDLPGSATNCRWRLTVS